MAKNRINDASERFAGLEPVFAVVDGKELTKLELIVALNWYNCMRDAKQAKKYLLASLKDAGVSKDVLSGFNKIDDADCRTVGYLARMVSRGAKLSQEDNYQFENALTGLMAAAELEAESKVVEVSVVGVPKVSIQDRIRAQANRVIGEFESILDSRKYKTNIKEILVNAGVKGPQGKIILEWVDARVKEFTVASKTKDEQLKEGYSNYSKADLKAILAWLSVVSDTLSQIVSAVKASRKKRTKKEKPLAQVVGAVKYLKAEESLKVTSLDPTQIVGAAQLWVFNVKTRKLGVFVASDEMGLTVKGTTVKGFDEKKSVAKTVRKPEVKIPELMGAGKVALRTFMDGIKAKAAVLKGRISGDVLLLKVVK